MAGRARKHPKKLSVNTDPEQIRRLGEEKYATGLTIGEIVNRRLDLSYQVCPRLDEKAEPVTSS